MAIIQIGVIESLHGQVSVIHADGSTEVLQVGSEVYADDTVITADEGTASIRFIDGTARAFGPELTATLDSEIFDPSSVANPCLLYTSDAADELT